MKDKDKSYMGAGERERILGTGSVRETGKRINQRKYNDQMREVMGEIKKTRGKY